MENNLDKYFRDNLHERKFEMKEEFWLQAEHVLEADERRRKRRGLFWWFGSGLAVLSLLVFGWWISAKEGTTQSTATAAKSEAIGQETLTVFKEKTEKKSSAQADESGQEKAVAEPLSEVKSNPNEAGVRSDRPKNLIPKIIDNQQVENKKASSIFPKNPAKNDRGQTRTNTKPLITEVAANTGTSTSTSVEQTQLTTAKTTEQNIESPLVEAEQMEREGNLSPLAILITYVKGNFEKALSTNANLEKIEVAKQRRLHLGLLASQFAQPTPDRDEVTLLGQRLGLTLRLDLRGDWYFSSGIQYQRRSGSFDPSKSATQRNYRFGLEFDTLLLRPFSLHYVSVPALLGWEHNRHQLEAGLLLDYLTGVRGEVGSYQRTGEEPPRKVFQKEKTGWVDESGYRRFVPTVQLSYRHLLGKKWSVGLSGNYALGGILDKDYVPPGGSFLLKESNKFTLGLQVTYFFN